MRKTMKDYVFLISVIFLFICAFIFPIYGIIFRGLFIEYYKSISKSYLLWGVIEFKGIRNIDYIGELFSFFYFLNGEGTISLNIYSLDGSLLNLFIFLSFWLIVIGFIFYIITFIQSFNNKDIILSYRKDSIFQKIFSVLSVLMFSSGIGLSFVSSYYFMMDNVSSLSGVRFVVLETNVDFLYIIMGILLGILSIIGLIKNTGKYISLLFSVLIAVVFMSFPYFAVLNIQAELDIPDYTGEYPVTNSQSQTVEGEFVGDVAVVITSFGFLSLGVFFLIFAYYLMFLHIKSFDVFKMNLFGMGKIPKN